MPNIHRGEYALKIGGIDFVLKFDSNAFAELEEVLGESVQALLTDINDKISFRFVRAALYAGLLHDRRFKAGKWTVEKAGNMVTLQNMGEIASACMFAIASALSGKTPDEIKKEQDASQLSTEVVKNEARPLESSTGINIE